MEMRATQQAAVKQRRSSDPSSQRHHDEVILAPAGPGVSLSKKSHPGVIFNSQLEAEPTATPIRQVNLQRILVLPQCRKHAVRRRVHNARKTHRYANTGSKPLLRPAKFVFKSVQYGAQVFGLGRVERRMKKKCSIIHNSVCDMGSSKVDRECLHF
jgi:hypothetical protein